MTLQSAIEAELPFLRAEAEGRMTSTCTIRRRTGRMTQSELTGREIPVWDITHADLPCRVGKSAAGGGSRTVSNSSAGGVEFTVAGRLIHLPASTTDLLDNDFIDVTSGECAGSAFRVIEADWNDQTTAHRLPVEAVVRPEEW